MRKTAVILTLAGLVAVGCGGDEATADATAEVLGVQITEGGEMHTVTAEPDPSPTPDTLRVTATTFEGNLNWGAAEGGGCVAIGDALTLERDNYVLAAHVQPLVEGDCPDWENSYDLGCDMSLQAATERPTTMLGEVTFELLVDGSVEATWTMNVDEQLAAGEVTRLGIGETVSVASADQPEVTCRASFEAA